jgi:hypothetical protein
MDFVRLLFSVVNWKYFVQIRRRLQSSFRHGRARTETMGAQDTQETPEALRADAIRPDIEAGDVVLVLAAVSRQAPPASDEFGDMMFRRFFALMMDGLRATPGSPLPGRPIGDEDIEELRQRNGLVGPGELDPPDTPGSGEL